MRDFSVPRADEVINYKRFVTWDWELDEQRIAIDCLVYCNW